MRPFSFCFVGEMRTKSQEEETIFIDCQITELVHGQGVRVSFGVVFLNFLKMKQLRRLQKRQNLATMLRRMLLAQACDRYHARSRIQFALRAYTSRASRISLAFVCRILCSAP